MALADPASGGPVTIPAVVHARLVCSDGRCAVLYEAYGPLEELEALGCDCGCALQVLAWPVPLDGDEGGRAVRLVPLNG